MFIDFSFLLGENKTVRYSSKGGNLVCIIEFYRCWMRARRYTRGCPYSPGLHLDVQAQKKIKSGGTNASQREPHAPRWNAESGERGEKRERGFFSVSNNPYIYISFHLLHVMERLLKRHYIQVVQLSVYTQSGSKKGRWYIRYPQFAFIRQSSRRTHTHT